LVTRAFRRFAARQCIVWEGGSATYAATGERISALAAFIQERTEPEAHVGILLPNSREFLELILATALAGRVRVPLNTRETPAAVAHKLDFSSTVLLFTTDLWREKLLAEDVDAFPETVVVGESDTGGTYEEIVGRAVEIASLERASRETRYRLSFTGGTTGVPKAVVQTNHQELALIRNLLMEAFTPSERRPFVAATPLSHASGSFVLPAIVAGGSLAWTDGFDADRLLDGSWLGEEMRTQTFLVPTALEDLVRAVDGRDHAVSAVLYGGAPCPPGLMERAAATIGSGLVQLYGQAEAPMTISLLTGADHADPSAVDGSAGAPFLFVDVAIEQDGERLFEPGAVGEVVVRSDHVMQGYWNAPEETSAKFTPDGGLRTNDLGYLDEHDRLWIVGRNGEMLISGGYNVFPSEIERRLGAVDGVRELAVFGVPHPRWGEATVVAVVPEADSTSVEEAVRAAAGERLATYERPQKVVVVDNLPLTAVGKVDRGDLAKAYHGLFSNS
jgi:acyl-CoA synthetase (AMP-forming)/AMP-acid ligase II